MKTRVIIILTVILLSLGALIFFTGGEKSGTIVLADTNQVVAKPVAYQNREIRVRGFVKPGSILRFGNQASFILTLDGYDLPVVYDGSTQLPDTFADGVNARADGYLNNKNQLVSSKVEAKCASKYEAEYEDRLKMAPKSVGSKL